MRIREVVTIWRSLVGLSHLPQVDKWLSEQFKNKSKFGSKDRKWYSEVLFGMIRFVPLVLEARGELSTDLTKNFLSQLRKVPVEEFLYWTLLRLSEPSKLRAGQAQLTNTFESDFQDLSRVLSKELKRNLTEDLAKLGLLKASPSYFGWLPEFLPELASRIEASEWNPGEEQRFVSSQASRPPLWLRLNFADKETAVCEELKSLGFEVSVERWDQTSPVALKVVGAKGIYATDCYRNGWVEIQDLASQRIGQMIASKPGDFVWDACAGGGGKTMQVASRAQNKGVIYASDVREYKLEEVKKRARRAGFFNIRCHPWSGQGTLPASKEVQLRGGFDWVLVDAPCSSSGTWRRNPDAKYRTQPAGLGQLNELQLQLLREASLSVNKSGKIVYSTCSWLVSENEQIVGSFLEENNAFELLEQKMVGLPHEDADTMFVAVMMRKGT